MTTEEKARAYDEALKVLHKYDGAHIMLTQDLKEEMFPELKESENERIRKVLYGWVYTMPSSNFEGGFSREDILAWLERQGEREPDIRYKYLDELLAADDIYQMSMNEAMTNGAKIKAVSALSKMCISELLGLEKQKEQKPAWSEEDEKNLKKVVWYVENPAPNVVKDIMLSEWLKSLRPQKHWKPSDEQMIALRDVISGCSYDIEPLVELETKLKEL